MPSHPLHPSPDLFPTRLDRPATTMLDRPDPILHGPPDQRADGPLSAEELERFERDGFLVLDSYLREDEVSPLLEVLDDRSAGANGRRRPEIVREPDSDRVRSIFAVHQSSERVARWVRDPRLLGVAEQILGRGVYVHQSRINCKPGLKGRGFSWHSDFETWHAEDGLPRMRSVSCSILLTDNDVLNGPLMLIPGSHRIFVPTEGETPADHHLLSLRHQQVGVPGAEAVASLIERAGGRADGLSMAEGPTGTVVFFDCNTLHASADNLSPFPRANLFLVYNSVENTPHAPYCGRPPRPDFLCERRDFEPLVAA